VVLKPFAVANAPTVDWFGVKDTANTPLGNACAKVTDTSALAPADGVYPHRIISPLGNFWYPLDAMDEPNAPA